MPVSAEPTASLFKAVNLSHVTLAASNLERTREFYQSILGLTAYEQNEIGLFLDVGEHFNGVGLASKANEKGGY